MTAIEELKAEHEAVLLTIQVLEQITSKLKAHQTVDIRHLDQILEFLQVFVDRCHHGKEERVLFPTMEDAGFPREGGPIGVMLYEHDKGRSYVEGLKRGIEDYRIAKQEATAEIIQNAQNYGQLLTAHIEKENNVLYVMAERLIPSDKMTEVADMFAKIEETEIGKRRYEEFLMILNTLKDVYIG